MLIDNNWLFDFAFLVDITSHLNDLNLKLQGKNKLFPSLVDCIKAFKMKLKLFISQLENQDLSHFPHLKEQRDISNNKGNMTEYVEKLKLIQDSFENRFQDFAKDEHSMIAFTNPFLLNDEQIMKMPSSIQMELIDLKTNSLLKTMFEELKLVENDCNTIKFRRLLPHENFSELQRFAQRYICRFGSTYRCEQAFSAMNLIKTKTRSRLTDLNLKNCLLLSVTDLSPDIQKLARSKQSQKSH